MAVNIVDSNRSVGIVQTQYLTLDEGVVLESGETLSPVTLAYETCGTLNIEKSNGILVLHALSGDAHAAGFHAGDKNPGWWDALIGPGKAFDTDRYFVICSNVIGGCKGSTGPSSIDPKTDKPYGLDFPAITIKDMVNAQSGLVKHLGIKKLLAVAGGSMGGMQALEWAISYPEKISSAIVIATTSRHSPQQIAFNEVGRQAIMSDPDWKGGNYYSEGISPVRGLSLARMIGHITYMSDSSMSEKFGRRVKGVKQNTKFSPDFEVEGYLQYKGDNFVKRFDANSYLYITKALDLFDSGNLNDAFGKAKDVKFLVMAFTSDWLYPAYQSKDIVKACKLSNIDVTYCELNSTYGHDAFLIEIEGESNLIGHFLRRISHE
jgi:homoserine O-acetyltransferase